VFIQHIYIYICSIHHKLAKISSDFSVVGSYKAIWFLEDHNILDTYLQELFYQYYINSI